MRTKGIALCLVAAAVGLLAASARGGRLAHGRRQQPREPPRPAVHPAGRFGLRLRADATRRSARARGSPTSPHGPSTSAPPMRRSTRLRLQDATVASRSRGRFRRPRSRTTFRASPTRFTSTARRSPESISGRSRTGTTPRSRSSTRSSTCRTWRSPRCTVQTARATPMRSPTICSG